MTQKAVTPLRSQYLSIKRRYPEAIVFFRLGDFYETFDTDAETTARELEIVLTAREMGKGVKVPMAGIPYHAVDNYLARLIARGHKVAICEQTTRPGDQKGLVEREVVRMVTPGTVIEPNLLDGRRNNYLAAMTADDETAGLAYVDISTGEFAATELPRARLSAELERLQPAEILLPENGSFQPDGGIPASRLPDREFEPEPAAELLKNELGVATLEGFGLDSLPLATGSAGAVVAYLKQTHKEVISSLGHPSVYRTAEFMALDDSTVTNLEIFRNATTGETAGSLLGVLDVTVTTMGARLLRRWLGQPLLEAETIRKRQDSVAWLYHRHAERADIRHLLKGFADLERVINRVRAFTAQPREIIALKRSLALLPKLVRALGDDPATADIRHGLKDLSVVVSLIETALENEPTGNVGEGGIIRRGFSAELDELRDLAAGAKSHIARLEAEERSATGIKSLKAGYNQVFGYYLEVSSANLSQVPERFIRKQTLANAERYITPELKEYEARILSSRERLEATESDIYRRVLGQIAESAEAILTAAGAVARLDALAALAAVATEHDYVKPEIGEGIDTDIEGGRHPVVEAGLPPGRFIANDTRLTGSDDRLVILTGPNMAGKSTYLKQTALITLMAQTGSFVPAGRAVIGITDRIFTRIGAHEDLAGGKSTFMVEMVETANILANATDRSLLILDEIGRGTSTYDGLAIARAVVEYIHDHIGARTLFATHYHELVGLGDSLEGVRNCNVAVSEDRGEVVFLHRIVPGGVDRSYGIHVAKLAGLPKAVIRRANEVLLELEARKKSPMPPAKSPAPQLALFAPTVSPAVEALRQLDIDALSPRQALEKLYELKEQADSD
jgi:DNA mismatch repair protein MutS